MKKQRIVSQTDIRVYFYTEQGSEIQSQVVTEDTWRRIVREVKTDLKLTTSDRICHDAC